MHTNTLTQSVSEAQPLCDVTNSCDRPPQNKREVKQSISSSRKRKMFWLCLLAGGCKHRANFLSEFSTRVIKSSCCTQARNSSARRAEMPPIRDIPPDSAHVSALTTSFTTETRQIFPFVRHFDSVFRGRSGVLAAKRPGLDSAAGQPESLTLGEVREKGGEKPNEKNAAKQQNRNWNLLRAAPLLKSCTFPGT